MDVNNKKCSIQGPFLDKNTVLWTIFCALYTKTNNYVSIMSQKRQFDTFKHHFLANNAENEQTHQKMPKMLILGPFLAKISHYIKCFVQFVAELIKTSLNREEYISFMYERVICSGK